MEQLLLPLKKHITCIYTIANCDWFGPPYGQTALSPMIICYNDGTSDSFDAVEGFLEPPPKSIPYCGPYRTPYLGEHHAE